MRTLNVVLGFVGLCVVGAAFQQEPPWQKTRLGIEARVFLNPSQSVCTVQFRDVAKTDPNRVTFVYAIYDYTTSTGPHQKDEDRLGVDIRNNRDIHGCSAINNLWVSRVDR